MKKDQDLQTMTLQELEAELAKCKDKAHELRLQNRIAQLKTTHEIRSNRRRKAKVLTMMNEIKSTKAKKQEKVSAEKEENIPEEKKAA